MSELLFNLRNFIPLRLDESNIQEYLDYHFLAIEEQFKKSKNIYYLSCFFHLHLIYMTLIYLFLRRILQSKTNEERKLYLLGFPEQEKKKFKNDNDDEYEVEIKNLSNLNERAVFRLFYIASVKKELIDEAQTLVSDRNTHFHAKLNLIDEGSFNDIFKKYINSIENILDSKVSFLVKQYKKIIVSLSGAAEDIEIYSEEFSKDDVELNFLDFSKYEFKLLSNEKLQLTEKQSKLSERVLQLINE